MATRGLSPRAQLHWDISADRGLTEWDDRCFRSRSGHEEVRPRQLELFSDGARAIAAAKRPKPPRPTEADLQARLDAARQRLHEPCPKNWAFPKRYWRTLVILARGMSRPAKRRASLP
jgi:hypothetical protein